ncbi:hypothetical protein R50072_12110 [Simiduia litorea]|uniref:hypothetical protein n=1 Tax=Simiduia litorea TaxID=1435348 RepID=UPI0036F1CA5D
MTDNIEDFDAAHTEKLKHLTKEERAKAGLRKLSEAMEANKNGPKEPEGMASGATDKNGKMIIDLDEDKEDEQ